MYGRFGFGFFEWWAGLSRLTRNLVGAIPLGVSVYLYLAEGKIWIWGYALGVVLLAADMFIKDD